MNILLNWESSSCATPLSQKVEYKKRSDSDWTLYASVPCGVNSIYINDLDDDVLYEFRVGSFCSDGLTSAIVYSSYNVVIKINCVNFDSLTPSSASIDYSFTGNDEYESYDVVLLSDLDLELDRENKVYAATITGTFSGLSPNTTYKLRIEPIAFFEKFKRIDCPTTQFLTEYFTIPDCSTVDFDIIIVNDESGSIGLDNYNDYVRPGILNIVRQLSALIDSLQIKVGVIGFSNFVKTRASLSDDYTYIFDSITKMGYLGETTGSAEALRKALDWIEDFARDVPVKVIFITDGAPNKCYNFPSGSASCPVSLARQQMIDAATNIKNTIKGGVNVEIIAVGVTGSVDTDILRDQIASTPETYFEADSFEEFEDVATDVAMSICANFPAPLPDPCIACTDVTAFLINQPNQTCIPPSNVLSSILTLPYVCNKPVSVVARIVVSCSAPTVISSILL